MLPDASKRILRNDATNKANLEESIKSFMRPRGLIQAKRERKLYYKDVFVKK